MNLSYISWEPEELQEYQSYDSQLIMFMGGSICWRCDGEFKLSDSKGGLWIWLLFVILIMWMHMIDSM